MQWTFNGKHSRNVTDTTQSTRTDVNPSARAGHYDGGTDTTVTSGDPRLTDWNTDPAEDDLCYDPASYQPHSPVTLCTENILACMSSDANSHSLSITASKISLSISRKPQQNQTLEPCHLRFLLPTYTKEGRLIPRELRFHVNPVHQSCTRSSFVRFWSKVSADKNREDISRYCKLNIFFVVVVVVVIMLTVCLMGAQCLIGILHRRIQAGYRKKH